MTISGTNFTGATAVNFGVTAATSFTVNGATQITASAPAGSGQVDVTVHTAGGTSSTTAADRFTYIAAPAVTGISRLQDPPVVGAQRDHLWHKLYRRNCRELRGHRSHRLPVNSATQITATAPTGTGTDDVTVTSAGGTT